MGKKGQDHIAKMNGKEMWIETYACLTPKSIS